MQKKENKSGANGAGSGRGGGGGGGVRMDVNEGLKLLCKCKEKSGAVGVRLGGQGGCERIIEFIWKMQKVGGTGCVWLRGKVGREQKTEVL